MSMNAQLTPGSTEPVQPPAPCVDRKFIEEHQLLERYLIGKLPLKGARDLENWCRANPQYLEELQLGVRAQGSLKLLEAAGQDGCQIPIREPVGNVSAAAKLDDVGVKASPAVNKIAVNRLCHCAPPHPLGR